MSKHGNERKECNLSAFVSIYFAGKYVLNVLVYIKRLSHTLTFEGVLQLSYLHMHIIIKVPSFDR